MKLTLSLATNTTVWRHNLEPDTSFARNSRPKDRLPFAEKWCLIILHSTKETIMDFIERLFKIAPDSGSGTLEFLLFALPIIGICYLVIKRRLNYRK